MDDVAAFTSSVNGGAASRYYVASNSLFSSAVLTNTAGQIVERFEYDAYGKQAITSPTGVVRAKSAVGWDRGFTGYVADNETGLLYARARMYSTGLGRFVGRDLVVLDTEADRSSSDGYADGYSLYAAWFSPNANDPTGREVTVVLVGGDGKPFVIPGTDTGSEWERLLALKKWLKDQKAGTVGTLTWYGHGGLNKDGGAGATLNPYSTSDPNAIETDKNGNFVNPAPFKAGELGSLLKAVLGPGGIVIFNVCHSGETGNPNTSIANALSGQLGGLNVVGFNGLCKVSTGWGGTTYTGQKITYCDKKQVGDPDGTYISPGEAGR